MAVGILAFQNDIGTFDFDFDFGRSRVHTYPSYHTISYSFF
jgi:hypothetical protein